VTVLAEICVAPLEVQGQAVERTLTEMRTELSEMSTEAGGFLLAEDVPRVHEKAHSLFVDGGGGGE
jgi:hypothetical protein